MRAGFHDHTESSMSIRVVSTATTAQGYLGPVPPGYCWYVERATAFGNHASTAPTCELFVLASQTVDPSLTATVGDRTGRQDLTLLANNAVFSVSDGAAPIYVGPDHYLVAFWSTVSENDVMQVTFQIAVHVLTLAEYSEPPLINAEVAAEHKAESIDHTKGQPLSAYRNVEESGSPKAV